jgi:hypothetical protein
MSSGRLGWISVCASLQIGLVRIRTNRATLTGKGKVSSQKWTPPCEPIWRSQKKNRCAHYRFELRRIIARREESFAPQKSFSMTIVTGEGSSFARNRAKPDSYRGVQRNKVTGKKLKAHTSRAPNSRPKCERPPSLHRETGIPKPSVIGEVEIIQVDGIRLLFEIAITLVVDRNSMPGTGSGVVIPVQGMGFVVQGDRLVQKIIV